MQEGEESTRGKDRKSEDWRKDGERGKKDIEIAHKQPAWGRKEEARGQ